MKLTALAGGILLICATLYCQARFAPGFVGGTEGYQNGSNAKVVKDYYTAFEKKDWNLMQGILADGFTFTSPLDDHISLKAFKERCWPNAYKIKGCDLEKLVVSGDSAFAIYNGRTTEDKLFRNSDYFKLKDGKIISYECFFGPGINYPNSGK